MGMSARAMGSATISFGLVTIPIKLYSATESSSGVSFNLLHEKCKGRVKQQYICPRENNEVVERSALVKGYEFAKDQYVIFTEEELKALEEAATKTIEITEFIPLEKVDPIYFERPYYLGPDRGADKSYQLLIAAMKETGRCAIAKYAARGKQYLVLLRPHENALVMQELKYADELKSLDEIETGKADVKEMELKLAIQLIEQISAKDFEPEKYHDDVKDRMLAQIEKKVQGEEISVAQAAEPQGKIIDLMEALKASLSGKPATAGEEATEEERKQPKRAARKVAEPAKRAKGHKS
jgi:DNA end-binding protein Ku